ncbi:MAG TPA: hypothetical protein VKE49_11260, partial [Myxococcaceae bacterium]|nr:hypothetical protein [Myxococcaceae bacterium]
MPPAAVAETNAAQAERDALSEALAKYESKDLGAALDGLQRVIDSPAFSNLSSGERHKALFFAGIAALQSAQPSRAHAFVVRASEMEEAGSDDWLVRFSAAWTLGNHLDAMHAIATLARRWPQTLSLVPETIIFILADEASRLPPENTARFDFPDALFQAQWRPARAIGPSSIWKNLALVLLERGDVERAIKVAAQINVPSVLIAMRVDKRFDSVVKADPRRFDIRRAEAEQTARFRAAVAAAPRSLIAVQLLAWSLLKGRKYREVLRLTDEALDRLGSSESSPYDDAALEQPWVMNTKARALEALGRWNEAVDELERASRLPENGQPNISQTINLAHLYCRLDRPKDALAVLSTVKEASPYGWMEIAEARASAAIETQDAAALESALTYLREHQADSPETFQEALTRAGQIDEAARVLISRLSDPNLRGEALLSVQKYP